MPSALDGITVVDLSRGMAGSLAAMFLCDNGARVIRVENSSEPEHPRLEGYRIWNRGKESLALALAEALQGLDSGESPELTVFDKLVRKADVILETFRPSSAYQRLVEFERLRSINSGVIHCSITGYGKRGPLKDCDPDEQLVMARAGISGAAPTFRPGPSYVTHPIPGINSALMAAQGISASLLARQKSGAGRSMETSLLAGALIPASQFRSENKQMSPYRGVPSGRSPRSTACSGARTGSTSRSPAYTPDSRRSRLRLWAFTTSFQGRRTTPEGSFRGTKRAGAKWPI